jgi:hypothetical protein
VAVVVAKAVASPVSAALTALAHVAAVMAVVVVAKAAAVINRSRAVLAL